MDRKIEKKTWDVKRLIFIGGGLLLLVLLLLGAKLVNRKVYRLDASRITVKKAFTGDFQDAILIDGDVEPVNLVLVNTVEGGTVEEIFVEDGVFVEKGTPLLRISNPTVLLNYLSQETAIAEQINNLRNLKLSLEKDQRALEESLIDSENNLANSRRAYKTDSVLYQKNVIAKNDFVNREKDYKYLTEKRNFLQSNVNKSLQDSKTQLSQINQSISRMSRNLELINQSIENMLIKAPVSGRLSSFDPVIGESYNSNTTVAKIDVLSGFKIRGSIDEFYLGRVKPNQLARFSLDGGFVPLKVKKVLPEVQNGRFEVELVFADETPASIAIGQSLQVRLELSQTTKALLIPKGAFFQASGGQFVFVLNDKGEAVKRQIKIGRQSPVYYEILEGLDEGDQFISSSYEAYKDYELIEINQ
ncbi:HlyD family efflux transporter periplasmic adaptor subunit [Leptobacterium flavescens]|uniref:HlyD family efflux transporter periplasmic adaptor subunit n=1 Tax=Leptobacterium flavescens TaxID=472055 RepID=A0A6P0UMB1_9FLAO|nr:HlyD family efflux transporter periplasmic adaptor subunit [Leptobacterium flavescens]NER14355.1 HlyD family efflux transporter periplasmic adaptor subunit [Leptobacterium flavescens]